MRLLSILLIVPIVGLSQTLTELHTKDQVENLIKDNFKCFGYPYNRFEIETDESRFDSFKEGDFDHDGIKDLLVFGTAHVVRKRDTIETDEIVILIGDRHRVKKVNFPYGSFRNLGTHVIPYPRVIRFRDRDLIVIRYEIVNARKQTSQTFHDTLFVKNDHVIPFTEKPSQNGIRKIEFRTDYCFGTCPVFEMSFDDRLEVLYRGIEYVDRKGNFKLKAQQEDWDYLVELIKNLKVQNLKDDYEISWTDHQTGFLTIKFVNGEEKKIRDYGLSGTFGLSVLYEYFFELRKF